MKKILVALGAFALLGAAVAYYRYKLLERFEVLDDPTDDEEEASGDLSPNLPSWDGPVGARGFKGGPLSG